MKKLIIATTALLLLINVFAGAQEAPKKKKPGFSLNEPTMTELELSPEQKQKIRDMQNAYRAEMKKLQDTTLIIDNYNKQREDSVLTADQQQKVTALREAVKAENKANPAARKTFVFDKPTMDHLGLSAEQQEKLTKLKGAHHIARWQISQRMGKLQKSAIAEQESVLTAVQQQKVAEIKAGIADYNKDIK